MEVNGDQVAAKQFVLTTIGRKAPKGMNSTKVPWQLQTLEAIGGESAVEKDPKKVRFDPSKPELYFLVGTNLSLIDMDELISLLTEFRKVFSWSVYEASGVCSNLACHSLSIFLEAKPVTQKRRKLAPERAEIVIEEVNRLLDWRYSASSLPDLAFQHGGCKEKEWEMESMCRFYRPE